jgi:hypothetical protein
VTISKNSANSGGSMYNNTYSLPKIRNSIIWGNSSHIVNNTITPEVYYSIVQGGGYPSSNPVAGSNYNLTVSPQFVLLAASAAPTTDGDYRLQNGSPAINAGSNAYYGSDQTPNISTVTTDLDGTERIKGGTVDMGAYEKE